MSEWEALFRVGVAVVLGAALGLEREMTAKPAGLRTYILVAEGAALFMVASILITQSFAEAAGAVRADPTRIASTIVTGVGFLGGGIIFRTGARVIGLTTAAGVWVAAAIGMLAGAGFYIVSVVGTVLGLLTLLVLRVVERRLDLVGTSRRMVEDIEEIDEEE
ncbi:MAG: MgtC/SapB family protein [Thermomicrobiaceae bacterium]|nr:MgtC/SapB family protein [Thermomicrobiaceae bacterium]